MHALIKKFKPAFEGLILCFKDLSIVIQFALGFCVLIFGFVFGFTGAEWMIVLGCMGLVFVTEILNTAIEELCNFIEPNHNLMIKKIKDLSAAAVLMASMTAVVVGFLVLGGVLR